MLTRGSFCRSVWGTAPGRAATSIGLEGWWTDTKRKRSMQIKHNNINMSKQKITLSSYDVAVTSARTPHAQNDAGRTHLCVCVPFEGRGARSAMLIHPYCTAGTERCCRVTQVTSSPSTQATPPPMTRTPRINGGFGHTRQFLEPSGGAFYKSVPPWQSLPGIGPADLGQLWLVAYTGSQPLGICQTHSCPHPLPLPHIHTSLLCSPKADRHCYFLTFGTVWQRATGVGSRQQFCVIFSFTWSRSTFDQKNKIKSLEII